MVIYGAMYSEIIILKQLFCNKTFVTKNKLILIAYNGTFIKERARNITMYVKREVRNFGLIENLKMIPKREVPQTRR